ncbi:GNAT family N-acetyltransferase [Carnobacterium gallinarum]|uniref:GNAT family N-acetyltransferase n=1 Tax=Carnobacterium gallinarum TaxID=2749 RepID=UPI00054EE6C9|nr:GNAT family N-acetyltransferase [Carnobacterium gallinarum]
MEINPINYQKNSQQLLEHLDEYTKEKVRDLKGYESKKISYELTENEVVLGGIVGEIHWGALRIELFYVDEKARGKGVGQKLLTHVEAIAQEANCLLVLLETYSFNAPNFYLKNGYQQIGLIQDFPLVGESHHFMIKHLA